VTVRGQNEVQAEGSFGSHQRAGASAIGSDLVCARAKGLAGEHAADVWVVDVDRASRDVAFAIGCYGSDDREKGFSARRDVDVGSRDGNNVSAAQVAIAEAAGRRRYDFWRTAAAGG